MLGEEGDPRLGPLALGDVHQREQHCGLFVVDQFARVDGEIDQRAVSLDMLPGPRRLLLAGAVVGPGRIALEGLQAANGALLELGAAIAVMLDRGVVDGKNLGAVERADDHGDGIAVEQEAKRRFALLQLGDVDAQADDAAILGQPLLDQDDPAVGELLLVARVGLVHLGEPLGDPFLFAAGGFRIVAARDANAKRILEPRAGREQIGAAVIDLRILLVPENIAAFCVEKYDALRQELDRLAQPLMRLAGIRNRGLGLGAGPRNLCGLDGRMPAAVRQARRSFGEAVRLAAGRRKLQLLLSRPDSRHSRAPNSYSARPCFRPSLLKKRYLSAA